MFWLAHIRGYFIAGSAQPNFVCQFFYFSYAVISSTVVLATKDLPKTFGFIALFTVDHHLVSRALPYP